LTDANHSPGPTPDRPTGPDGPSWGGHLTARLLRLAKRDLADTEAALRAEREAHARLRAQVSRALALAHRRRDVDECRRILSAFGMAP
jgi:hypothetical protein